MHSPFVRALCLLPLVGLLTISNTFAQVRADTASTPLIPGKTINVRQSGARGDGVTDDAPAINDAIQKAKTLGPGSAVYVPAGRYLLASRNVAIDGLVDFTFYGGGPATILLEKDPNRHVINLDNSKNVTVKRLTLDRTDYYFTQGTIDSVNNEAKTLDVTVDPGYPAPDGAPMAPNQQIRVFRSPDRGYYDQPSIAHGELPEKLGDRRWRFHMEDARPAYATHKFIFWTDHLGGHGINLNSSSDCQIEDITYYGRGANAGLILWNCSGTMTMRRFNIDVPPGSGGLLSCSGGGMEIDIRGKLVFDQCDFEKIDDDGADITTHYTSIVAQADPRIITVASNENFRIGDRLAHIDWVTKVEQPGFKIVQIQHAPDSHQVTLTLDKPMTVLRPGRDPRNISFEEALKIGHDRVVDYDNVTTSTEFRHCKFQCLRARPLNLKAQNCLVDSCMFYNCEGQAISAGPEAAWMEAPYVHNLTIRNCLFSNNATTCIDIDCYQGMKQCVSYDNQNILIEGNVFRRSGDFFETPRQDPSNWRTIENFGSLAIHVHHCANVIIRNNDFGDRAPTAPDYNPMVLIAHCRNVTLESNRNLPPSEVKAED
jgi:hypothetical protein